MAVVGLGKECLGTVGSVFFAIEAYGVRSGASVQPFAQDIALRDRCREMLSRLPGGGAASQLFRELLGNAERDIQEAIREDEEL